MIATGQLEIIIEVFRRFTRKEKKLIVAIIKIGQYLDTEYYEMLQT